MFHELSGQPDIIDKISLTNATRNGNKTSPKGVRIHKMVLENLEIICSTERDRCTSYFRN